MAEITTGRHSVTLDELKEICKLTEKLVKLRQNECKHLCIESVAPEIFHKLLTRLSMFKNGIVCFNDDQLSDKQ